MLSNGIVLLLFLQQIYEVLSMLTYHQIVLLRKLVSYRSHYYSYSGCILLLVLSFLTLTYALR